MKFFEIRNPPVLNAQFLPVTSSERFYFFYERDIQLFITKLIY